MMGKLLVEGVGTFFLLLTVGLAAVAGQAGALAPLAIGAVLMALIYAGGHISGAHYNPAVTVAVWLRGRFALAEVPGYLAVQLASAALAAACVELLVPAAAGAGATFDLAPLLVAEVLFTFALCWVILHVATARGLEGNSFYGLAIGAVVAGGALAVGPVSGAVFNPAVALGLCLLGFLDWGILGAYLGAQLVGGVAAAFAFRRLEP